MGMIQVRGFNYQLMPGDVDRSTVLAHAHLAGLLGLGYGLTDDTPQAGNSFDADAIRAANIADANTRGSAQYDRAMELYRQAVNDWNLNGQRFAKPNPPPPPLTVNDANYDRLAANASNIVRYGDAAYLTSDPTAFVPYGGGGYGTQASPQQTGQQQQTAAQKAAADKLAADKAQAAINAAAADKLIADRAAADKLAADRAAGTAGGGGGTGQTSIKQAVIPAPLVGNTDTTPAPPGTVDDGKLFGMDTTSLLLIGGAVVVALVLANKGGR